MPVEGYVPSNEETLDAESRMNKEEKKATDDRVASLDVGARRAGAEKAYPLEEGLRSEKAILAFKEGGYGRAFSMEAVVDVYNNVVHFDNDLFAQDLYERKDELSEMAAPYEAAGILVKYRGFENDDNGEREGSFFIEKDDINKAIAEKRIAFKMESDKYGDSKIEVHFIEKGMEVVEKDKKEAIPDRNYYERVKLSRDSEALLRWKGNGYLLNLFTSISNIGMGTFQEIAVGRDKEDAKKVFDYAVGNAKKHVIEGEGPQAKIAYINGKLNEIGKEARSYYEREILPAYEGGIIIRKKTE